MHNIVKERFVSKSYKCAPDQVIVFALIGKGMVSGMDKNNIWSIFGFISSVGLVAPAAAGAFSLLF